MDLRYISISFPEFWSKLGHQPLRCIGHFFSASGAFVLLNVLCYVLRNLKSVIKNGTNPGLGGKQEGLFIFHLVKNFKKVSKLKL
jgi:hypothetical protein